MKIFARLDARIRRKAPHSANNSVGQRNEKKKRGSGVEVESEGEREREGEDEGEREGR